MLGEHHYLATEMPEYKDIIHQLKVSDRDFAKLYNIFVEVDKVIYRIEEGIETPSDQYTQTLKHQRALLKDEICDMLKTT